MPQTLDGVAIKLGQRHLPAPRLVVNGPHKLARRAPQGTADLSPAPGARTGHLRTPELHLKPRQVSLGCNAVRHVNLFWLKSFDRAFARRCAPVVDARVRTRRCHVFGRTWFR